MSLGDFDILSQLGSGSFGRVFKVKKKTDTQIYALKQIDFGNQNQRDRENALNQVRLLASINSPYIIGFKECFFDELRKKLCIVMEFAPEGDLQKKIEEHIKKGSRFKESDIWNIISNLLAGVRVLHQNKILHRDIKAANIFFSGGVAKLGDLNVSRVLHDEKFAKTQTGTPYYTSPQIWMGKAYGPKCDIWSIGCVVYEMAMLRPPFDGKSFEGLSKKVLAGVYKRIEGYSQKLTQFIQKCLQVDDRHRWTAQQLCSSKAFSLSSTFQQLDESSVELLQTIRVPKVLKLLNDKLPESQYTPKHKKGQQATGDKGSMAVIPQFQPKSLKNIKSQKFLPAVREPSIDRIRHNENYHHKHQVESFKAANDRKLPRIDSHKNIPSNQRIRL